MEVGAGSNAAAVPFPSALLEQPPRPARRVPPHPWPSPPSSPPLPCSSSRSSSPTSSSPGPIERSQPPAAAAGAVYALAAVVVGATALASISLVPLLLLSLPSCSGFLTTNRACCTRCCRHMEQHNFQLAAGSEFKSAARCFLVTGFFAFSIFFAALHVCCPCADAARSTCSACMWMPFHMRLCCCLSMHSRPVSACMCSSICIHFEKPQGREKSAKFKSGPQTKFQKRRTKACVCELRAVSGE